MKTIKIILIATIGVLVIPIFSLFLLSFKSTNSNLFQWYIEIVNNENFISAFLNSFTTSLIVAFISVIIAFILSPTYYDRKKQIIVLLFLLLMGLMPPDVVAISINKISQIMGFNRANLIFLYFGLLIYCLPFGIIILWTRYYFIEKDLLVVSEDLGLSNNSIIFKIILPLSKTALLSVFLFSFLLSFNEYARTYYLSGSTEILSEYLNGKLSSGTQLITLFMRAGQYPF